MSDATGIGPILTALSHERLSKYLDASDGHASAALRLYEWNMRLSEAFYTPLQCLEVCLRNRIQLRLSSVYGTAWLLAEQTGLARGQMSKLTSALHQLRVNKKPITEGAVVAELSFGFWVGLLGSSYDQTLWRRAVAQAFRPGGFGLARSVVHGRMNMLRRFRNRVAHHEPVFSRDLASIYSELIEAISWMCPVTAAWCSRVSRVEGVLNEGHC